MYENEPVLIPEIPGKISIKKKGGSEYVRFQLQSRRKPDDPVNPYKASKINSILVPLRKLMAGEDYAAYLDLVDVSEEEPGSAHTGNNNGKTYSDVALMLTQYKGAMKRFGNEKM